MSGRHTLELVAVGVYAFVDALVIMAPSLAVKLAADRGGLGDSKGLDLVLASFLIAVPHAVIAARRLRDEERRAVRRADLWIASIDSLVVLALGTTLLIVTVLALFADEHAALANRGFPVVVLWFGLQLVAVALAEATGRLVFWWLEPTRRAPAADDRARARADGPDAAGDVHAVAGDVHAVAGGLPRPVGRTGVRGRARQASPGA